jgi:hypothetical protein
VQSSKAAADNDHAGTAGLEWFNRLVQRGTPHAIDALAGQMVTGADLQGDRMRDSGTHGT